MADSTITFIVLGCAVGLFVWNRLPVGIVAVGAALTLYATGVISVDQAFAGFGDQTVIFIASLFIVSEGLDAAGVTTWAGQRLIALAGGRERRLSVSLLVLVALLAAIITVNGAVAALVPMTVVVAVRLARAPSKLLLPLAFAGHAGSLLLLTGTPVNILVSNAAADSAGGRFGYFEFALVGVPLTVGAIVILTVLAPRLLPERHPRSMPPDLSGHARTLMGDYAIDRDVLARHEVPEELFTRRSGVAEVMLPPRSDLVGATVFPGMATESGDLIVLAVQRQGEDAGPGEVTLAAGDTLLLEGTWGALDEHLTDPDVLVVDAPDALRRQTVPLGRGAKRAIAVLGVMVVLLATGAVPAAVAGALAAGAIVVLRVLNAEQAHRAVAWSTVFLIAGMIPVSTAIQTTGAADDIATALVDAVGGAGPHVLLIGLFVITAVFGQVISNTATALIMIPIAVAAAGELDVSSRPVLMSLAVASAAAFITPIATPANLMVQGPGGYRFGDYWRLGLPMLALFFVVAVFVVPLIWAF
ncbi:MAG TPA: SLC13 family permease [Solirubrobacteraceae bacterium]